MTGLSKPPTATLKPPQSVLIANRLRLQSHSNATPMRPQSHPKATPRLHQSHPKAITMLPSSDHDALAEQAAKPGNQSKPSNYTAPKVWGQAD